MHYICCIIEIKQQMTYLEFKDKLFELACFNINQIYAWQPDFDRNNLTRWVKRGYLIRLRQGYFAFAEYKGKPDYSLYFANLIYRPSYISLHTALSFYGIIPESVVQITSVTSLKTESFSNDFGEFSYKNFKENLMFGYDLKPLENKSIIKIASPEKAILDLLYLYPFYNSVQEMRELRFDEDFLYENLNTRLLMEHCSLFESKALDQRVRQLFKAYGL